MFHHHGQGEVFLGDALCVVGVQVDLQLVVHVVPVRVVTHLLSHLTHHSHDSEGRGEVSELEVTEQTLLPFLPVLPGQ